MSFRFKVILTTVLMVVTSTLGVAILVASGFYRNLMMESELRAVALVEGVAQRARDDLASNNLYEIDRDMATVRQGRDGNMDMVFTVILDNNGRIVTREITDGYEQLTDNEFIGRAGAAETALRQTVVVDGHEIFLVSSPVRTAMASVPGIRWGTVIGGLDVERVQRSIIPVVRRSALVGGASLAMFIIIIVLFVRMNLILPIRRLTATTERFAAGDLATRADVGSHDEIGRLAQTFNEMAAEMQEQTRNLEDTVKARTWELEKANGRLQELAAMDDLTGLGNRRTFQSSLKREFRRSLRDGSRISMLMLDVDHFKNYNDNYGHPAGDVVLSRIGEIMRNRLRVTDIPCRYGGEEFAAILITTDRDAAFEVAEAIRARIEEEDFYGEGTQPLGCLTVSIGVATFPEDADDPDRLVDAADIALYAAKAAGRNQVRAFTSEMTSKFQPQITVPFR